ncbi:MAG: hypothetical protein Q8Q52_01245 [Acidimicrobiia bacterium]|nr:hypothetical protein [Acidimicrobiia bacterium]
MLRIYPWCSRDTVISFLDYLLGKLPLRVEVIQADNRPESASNLDFPGSGRSPAAGASG